MFLLLVIVAMVIVLGVLAIPVIADIDVTDALDDEFVATTLWEVLPTIYNQVFLTHPILSELENTPWRTERAGGGRIRSSLRTGKNTSFSTFDKGSVMTPKPYPMLNWCYWNYKQGAGDVMIDWVTEREQAGSGNIFDLMEQRVEGLIDGIREEMNTMLWSALVGNAGMDMNGMQLLLPTDPRTGVIAGLSRADHFWWRNCYWDNTALSFQPHPTESGLGVPVDVGAFGVIGTGYSTALKRMGTMINNCAQGESLSDYFIITDQMTYEQYIDSVQHMKNFRINYESNADAVQYNFGNALFRGIPIRFDSYDAPTGEMRIINKKYMRLISDSGAWMTWTEERKPYNQFVKVRYLLLRGQLIMLVPRKHAVLQGITAWA